MSVIEHVDELEERVTRETASDASSPDLVPILGANLRRLRVKRGLSLERLSKLSGVSRAMLSQVELAYKLVQFRSHQRRVARRRWDPLRTFAGPAAAAVGAEPARGSLFEFSPVITPDETGRRQFDVEAVRRDFPILREVVHGKRLVWLDNAATTQKPQSVIDRVSFFYEHENSNIHARRTRWLRARPMPTRARARPHDAS